LEANMSYAMSIIGFVPTPQFKDGMTSKDFVNEMFNLFSEWNNVFLCQEKVDGWNGIVIKENGVSRWDTEAWKKYNALINMLKYFDDFLPDDSIVAGEVGYGTEYETALALQYGYHRFICFDLIKFNGEWVKDLPAIERFNILKSYWEKSQYANQIHPIINIVRNIILDGTADENRESARKMFWNIVDNGGEGIILKKADSIYRFGPICDAYKFKKYLTKDYVCMGFVESNAPTYVNAGMPVASIKCGLYINGKLQYVMQTSGFPFYWRKEFAENPNKYIGRVLEVGGYEIFKSGAMRHSMFLRFRDDRKPEDCTL